MIVRRILLLSFTVIVLSTLWLLSPLTPVNAAATAPPMGAASSFAVLGSSTVTNTGSSVITGDVGLSPGNSITGFPLGVVVPPGTIHAADTQAGNARTDAFTAYNVLAGEPSNFGPFGPSDLVGATLAPGVYTYSSSVSLSGLLTLNGVPSDVWVFQIGSTLTTGPGASVVGTGNAANVFWQVGSSATLDTTTSFRGTVIALQSISVNNAASISGRLLALNGAVTLINDNVNASEVAGITPGGVGVSKIFTPAIISRGGVSTLTITFSNTNAGTATLLSPFIDALPSGLVIASVPNVAFSGGGGPPTATPGGSTVTLPAGSTIPGGNVSNPGIAILTVDVTSQVVGVYVNTLDVGVLHTNVGDNLLLTPPAGATLAVSLIVGGEGQPINKVEVILAMFVESVSRNWWVLAIAAIVAVAAIVVVRRRRP